MKKIGKFGTSVATKEVFTNLFMILVVSLMVLPLVSTFNEFLTKIVENTFFYRPIQDVIVPYEIKLTITILSLLGIETVSGETVFQVIKDGAPQSVYISWNCVGWQSFVILLISLKSGIQKGLTKTSKFEILAIGLLGTFLMNLFRISLVVIIFYFFGKLPALIFHDYGSILITIIWLIFFWWFSYGYVLEESNAN